MSETLTPAAAVTTDGTTDEQGQVPKPRRKHRKASGETARPEAGELASADAAKSTPDSADAAEARPKARRRRKGGEDADALARKIFGYHQLAAVITNSPEFVITEAEARLLAGASQEVMDEFDISIGGKYAALFGLLGTAGAIHFPRMIARIQRVQREKDEAEARRQAEEAARTIDATTVNPMAPAA